jgi:hypothetical protein
MKKLQLPMRKMKMVKQLKKKPKTQMKVKKRK